MNAEKLIMRRVPADSNVWKSIIGLVIVSHTGSAVFLKVYGCKSSGLLLHALWREIKIPDEPLGIVLVRSRDVWGVSELPRGDEMIVRSVGEVASIVEIHTRCHRRIARWMPLGVRMLACLGTHDHRVIVRSLRPTADTPRVIGDETYIRKAEVATPLAWVS